MKVQIVNHPLAQQRQKLAGDWKYNSGILTRGKIRKETLDLRSLLQTISIAPEAVQILVAEDAKAMTYWKTAAASPVVGMMAAGHTQRKVAQAVIFEAQLKDGRFFTAVSSAPVYQEMCDLDGVEVLDQTTENSS